MFLRCIIPAFFLVLPAMSQLAPPTNDVDKQRDLLRQESEEPGRIYGRMFQNGRDAGSLVALGDKYMNISKPIQARTHYRLALAADPESVAAKEGVAAAEKRVAYLDERLKHFQELREKEKKAMHACSQAAILFHMGFSEDALKVLQAATTEMGADFDIRAMASTIQRGDSVEVSALEALRESFRDAMEAKNLEDSYKVLGQMIFVSLCRIPPDPYLSALRKAFSAEVVGDQVADLLIDVTK